MEIEIGKRFGRRYALLVDAADFPLIAPYSWWPFKRENLVYARTEIDGRSVLIHRFILNPPADRVIDHIDGNPLNNQRSNLRLCSQGDNMRFARERGAFKPATHLRTIRNKLADGSVRTHIYHLDPVTGKYTPVAVSQKQCDPLK